MKSYLNPTVIAELLALVCSLPLLTRKTGRWQFFVPFMILTVVTDWVGWFVIKGLHWKSNVNVYNIAMIVCTTLLLNFFTWHKHLLKYKTHLRFAMLFYLVFCFVNLFFIEGTDSYNAYSETTSDVLLVILSNLLIYDMINQPKYENLLLSGDLWLSIGILIFCTANALLYIFTPELVSFREHFGINLVKYFNFSLSIVFYSCLSISFICTWKMSGSQLV
jgi:hypothetical protein